MIGSIPIKLRSWMICALCWAISIPTSAQQPEFSFPEIKLTLSNSQFYNLQKSKGTKLQFNKVLMTINDDTAKIKDIHLRGNNTLYFKRKSFSVDLDKSVNVTLSGQNVSVKKFHLLNLAMDKNLWHNRWSYLILSQLGLFPSLNSYCSVTINDEHQGIYLLVEKPQHASAALNSPYTIRRGVRHIIDNDYVETNSKADVKTYKKQYNSLYKTGNLHGEPLYTHLSQAINIDLYFRWLAFNYLIMNGDYADELFLYIHPETKLYEIIAWDYDDLFMISPHEGREVRSKVFKERMIFSIEDALDQTIISDDYVYEYYQESFKQLFATCDDTMLTATADQVLEELAWLSKDDEHCKASLYLDKEPFVIEDAKYDIHKSIEYLKNRRALVLKELNQSSND